MKQIWQSIKVPNEWHCASLQPRLLIAPPFNGTKALQFYDAISPFGLLEPLL